MTPKQKREHIELLKGIIFRKNFIIDPYGNYKVLKQNDLNDLSGVWYRFKFMKNNLRFERKPNIKGAKWSNVLSKPIVRITQSELIEILKKKGF